MRRVILVVCVLFVLGWSANVQAQGKGKNKAGEVAKADANAPAGEKKAATPQEMEKGAKEKGKAPRQRSQEQAKGAKTQGEEQMAQMKGKGREQQAKAFEKQAQRDMAKHMKRVAQLQRIRELAEQKGDQETVTRVDKLIAKENEVYNRKLQRIKGGGEKAMPQAGAETKGRGKPAEAKPEGQAAPPVQEKAGEAAAPAKPAEPQPGQPAQPAQPAQPQAQPQPAQQ